LNAPAGFDEPVRLAAGLLACLAAVGIAACGGGGSTAAVTTTPPANTDGAVAGGSPSRPAGAKQSPGRASPEGGGDRKSGAAGFTRPGADNSIPDFGTEADAGVRAEATAALNGYLAARAGGQWRKSCSYLGAEISRQVATFVKASHGEAPNCAALLKTVTEQVPEERSSPLRGALAAFRVEGDKGFALFYGPHRQQYMMPMVSESGAWKVNQLEPVPWPIGTPTASP
jgi:hypothetical protein